MKNFEIITLNKKNITDFAKERNLLLKKARKEWVLFLDSDEKITPTLKSEIAEKILNDKFQGFYIRRKNYFLGKYTGTDKILRLGRKKAGGWVRRVHEIWRINGNIGELKNPIIHNTAGTVSEMITKINFYSTLHAKANKSEQKTANLFKIFFYPKIKFVQSIFMGRGMVFSILMAFHSFLSWSKQMLDSRYSRDTMKTEKLNMSNIFIFLFFIMFPFGQIIRLGIIHPIDIVVGIAGAYTLMVNLKRPQIFRYFENFLYIALFSWIFGSLIFLRPEAVIGFLYLLRLSAYLFFLVYIWNFAKKSGSNKLLILNSLTSVSVISAGFGWLQYFAFPAIRPFSVWGWDDHLFRLVGTFLDPSFLGIIIVFGLLISIYRYMSNRKRPLILIIAFLLISLAFTYSRASYLAFLAGAVVIGLDQKKTKLVIYLFLTLAALILILPTSGNTILKITREFSAIARVDNYLETINIYKMSPVFGVGYDNLCLAKSRFVGYINAQSHACSGSDSSILFILATTGLAGIISLAYAVWGLKESVGRSPHRGILLSSFAALFVHSLFSNSLVYPWVLGWTVFLLAVNLGREV